MSVYFTADTHFGHANIIKYCNRPFADVEEHDQELVRRWNLVVPPDGVVYHLGDFAFGSAQFAADIRRQLNGEIHFIRGNHDKAAREANRGGAIFASEQDYLVLKGSPDIVMFHYPIYNWDKKHHGSWHLFGHVHNNPCNAERNGLCLNVGVDVCAFAPLTMEEVADKLRGREVAGNKPSERREEG